MALRRSARVTAPCQSRNVFPDLPLNNSTQSRAGACPRARHVTEANMRISARNQIKGKVVEVKTGATTAHVRVEIAGGVIVTAAITNEAVADLKLKEGAAATVVIKASDVMIAVD
jgi:molybdopterin-binding protein